MQDDSSIQAADAIATRLAALRQHVHDWRLLALQVAHERHLREEELDRQQRRMRQEERDDARREWHHARQEARRVRQEARHVRHEARAMRKEVRRLVRLVRFLAALTTSRHTKRLRNQARNCRPLIVSRDGSACRYCGATTGTFVVDHILPLSRGGSSDLENLALACEPCNLSKGAKTLDEWHAPVVASAPPYFA